MPARARRCRCAREPSAEVLAHGCERFQLGVERLRSVAESRRLCAEAAADFARLQQGGANTPALYLALGNAEALAGRWPQAIRAYESGRRLDPNDAVLRAHLEYAWSLVSYPPSGRGRPVPDAWPAWLHRPSADELLLVAAVAYSLAWLAGGWWYVRRQAMALAAGLFASALLAGFGYFLSVQQAEYDRQHPLVVVAADGTTLHRGNGPSYPLHADVPNLPAGLEARVMYERGSWLQVQLSTGEIGWVPRDHVLVVATRFLANG